MTNENTNAAPTDRPLPWWRSGMVWLVIGGPLAVVVASIATAVVAWTHIDPVVSGKGQGPAEEVATTADPKDPLAPAQKARNHVATPTR